MRVGIVATLKHHHAPAEAMQRGLAKHGIGAQITRNPRAVGPADLIVAWGLRNGNLVSSKCDHFLVMERAYFEPRFEWISLGYDGLNGRANFLNQSMPDDRFKKYFADQLKPWNANGDYVLLTTQVRGDQSIRSLNFSYQEIINKIKSKTKLPVYVKHHPDRPNDWPGLKCDKIIDRTTPIARALRGAKVVVTVNSNSGVDAILSGKPVINIDRGSMVWDVAMKCDFTKIDDPWMPDRTQWANNLAYCQWLPEEIAAGHAWDHLKQLYK